MSFRIDNLLAGKVLEDIVGNMSVEGANFPAYYWGNGSYAGFIDVRTVVIPPDLVHFLQVGRYTSIAGDICVLLSMDHDYRAVFQGVVPAFANEDEGSSFRQRIGQSDRTMIKKGMIIIGSDVWIGQGVTLLPSIVIGDGAVVAAGSVVTKDVPPYSIVAGNPAKVIKWRFPEDIRIALERIQWWNWDDELLTSRKEDFYDPVERFAIKYLPEVELKQYTGPVLFPDNPGIPILLAFIDVHSDFPSFTDVMNEFIKEFKDGSAGLVLAYDVEDEKENGAAGEVADFFKANYSEALVELIGISKDDEEMLISGVDFLFTGRDIRNIMRTSYAFKYGVGILSSVDRPVFTEKVRRRLLG